jgi:DNA-binding NtrC family response regulator
VYKSNNRGKSLVSRILIVDDDEGMLDVLKTLFEIEGYEITTCGDGNDAVDLIRSDEFDMLITDLRMNPVNGMWLLSLVKEEYPSIPVLIITAYHSGEKAQKAIEMGAVGYVSKPFDTTKLLDTVKEALTS